MNVKVKRGIGYIISGSMYIGVGLCEILLPNVPGLVIEIAQAVVLVAGVFGVRVIFPDTAV